MSLRMFAIIFCVLWVAILRWPLDVPMIAGVLTALAWFCLLERDEFRLARILRF